MNIVVLALAGFSFAASPTHGNAPEFLAKVKLAKLDRSQITIQKYKDIPWEKVNDDDDGLRVWNRDIPNSDVRELKAERVIDVSADKVWVAINDIEKYTEFMPYLSEVTILSRKPNQVVAYHRIDAPLISNRDYTLTITSALNSKEGHFFRHWITTNDEGPAPKKNFVRVTICEGSWTLEKMGPKKTRLRYWVHTHPGGSIPNWIVNKANSVSLPTLFSAIENRANDPSWKRD